MLVLQDPKQKFCKACSRCEKDTWHVESKHLVQLPNHSIITLTRFNYMNNIIMKNRSLITLDLNIILCPYKVSLQATVDHYGNFIHCGLYAASVNYCGRTFYCNDDRITECNTVDIRNSSTVYILLYKLIMECPCPDRGGWESFNSHGAGTFFYPFNHRSKSRRRNLWDR